MNIGFIKNAAAVLPKETEDRMVSEALSYLKGACALPIREGSNLEGYRMMLRSWYCNKGWSFEQKFKNDPNYCDFRVLEPVKYERKINSSVIADTVYEIKGFARHILDKADESAIYPWNHSEIKGMITRLEYKQDALERNPTCFRLADGSGYADVSKERRHYQAKLDKFFEDNEYYNGEYWENKSYKRFRFLNKLLSDFEGYVEETLNARMTEHILDRCPGIKGIREGMYTSKAFKRVCNFYNLWERTPLVDIGGGVMKNPLDKLYASYSDAIRPVTFENSTYLSVNPIDFLTGSRAENWTSCHTADWYHKDPMLDPKLCSSHTAGYRGCYAAGILSYLFDSVTLTTFSVKEVREDVWNASKVMRNLFHVGRNFLIQGRLYPNDQRDAGNTAELDEYRPTRHFVERKLCEAEGIPNLWESPVFGAIPSRYQRTGGMQYSDYTHYDNCNITFVKGEKFDANDRITIGESPLCIECGNPVYDSNTLFCSCDRDNGCTNTSGVHKYKCKRCGYRVDEDDVIWVGEEAYCTDCATYCECCDDGVLRSEAYSTESGNICSACYNYNNYTICERCGYAYREVDGVDTNDGHHYCCSRCAERAGYVEVNGEWYSDYETYSCEHCGVLFYREDEDAVYAEDTGERFCSESCARSSGYERGDGSWRICT